MKAKNILSLHRVFVFIAASSLLWAASACSGSDTDGADSANADSATGVPDVLPPEQTDSVAMLLGMLLGNDEAARLSAQDSLPPLDKDAYIRGLRATLSDSCASESFTNGLNAAYDLILQIENLKAYGVEIDRTLLLSAIEKALMADSVSEAQVQQITSTYNSMLQRVYE